MTLFNIESFLDIDLVQKFSNTENELGQGAVGLDLVKEHEFRFNS